MDKEVSEVVGVTDHVDRVYHIESLAVDCNEHLAVLGYEVQADTRCIGSWVMYGVWWAMCH